MKKITLVGAFLLTCPWMASAYDVGQAQQQQQQHSDNTGLSLEEVRARCEAFRNDSQIMEFEIKLQCTGEGTRWVNESKALAFAKKGGKTFHVSTKDNRYDTLPGAQAHKTTSHPGTCKVYTQEKVALPAGTSTEIMLTQCSDLEESNVARLCEESVDDYCSGNEVLKPQQQQQQQQQSFSGACTVETVQSIDTCVQYNK